MSGETPPSQTPNRVDLRISGNGRGSAGPYIENLTLQHGQFIEYLIGRKLDPARSEPCAVCWWMVAKTATSCPCCGANCEAEREHKVAVYMRKFMRPFMAVAVLLLLACFLSIAYGLSQVGSGAELSKAFPGTGPVLLATCIWVFALKHVHSKAVASMRRTAASTPEQ